MSYYLVFIFGCLSTLSLSTTNEVPTIAISCGNTQLKTLPKYQQSMDTIEFKKLLLSLWNKDTKVVMVLENELSLEDFTMKGNKNLQTHLVHNKCFPGLKLHFCKIYLALCLVYHFCI